MTDAPDHTDHSDSRGERGALRRWAPLVLGLLVFAALMLAPRASAGFWTPDAGPASPNRVVGRFLVAALAGLAVGLAPELVRRAGRFGLAAGAFWACWLGLALIALWPGTVEFDTAFLVHQTSDGVMDGWWSVTYAALVYGLFDLHAHIATVAVFQTSCLAAALAYASVVVRQQSKTWRPVVLLGILGLLSVPLVAYSVQQTRDTLFATGMLVVALRYAQVVGRGRGPSARETPLLLLSTAFVISMRPDAVAVLPLAAAVLWRYPPAIPHPRLAAAAIGSLALLIAFVAVPAAVERKDRSREYFLVNALNPLTDVLAGPWWSPHREQDLATLSRVTDLGKLGPPGAVDNVPAFWTAPASDITVDDATWQAYRRVVLRILATNPGPTVTSQARRGLVALNLGPGSENGGIKFITADWRARNDLYAMPRPVAEATEARPPSVWLYAHVGRWLRGTNEYAGPLPRGAFLHFNTVLFAAVLLCAVARWRRPAYAVAAVVAAFALVRLPIVLLAAPVAQFRYLIPVHLAALVTAALLLAAREQERAGHRIAAAPDDNLHPSHDDDHPAARR